MKCPRCRSVLGVSEYDGIQVEICSDCRGEWLHAEELEKVVEHHDHAFSAAEITELEAINQPLEPLEDKDRDVLNCPHCESIEMDRIQQTDANGILVHNCPECGGVWADKDQLEKVEEFVDGWKATLNQDAAKYRSILKKVASEERKELDRDLTITRFGFVNNVLRRL